VSANSDSAIQGGGLFRPVLCTLLSFLLMGGDSPALQLAASQSGARDRADWEIVRTIGTEKQIVVEARVPDSPSSATRSYRGSLRSWEPDGLVLQLRNGREVKISKSLVQRVSVLEKGSRAKGAAIGAAAGFGIGMVVGVCAFDTLDKHGSTSEKIGLGTLFGVVWGGIGALIGRAAAGTRSTTVYQAR